MFNELFAIMAPTIIGTAIGWCWARKGLAFPAEFVSKLVMNIGTPCLIVSAMAKVKLSTDIMASVSLTYALVMLASLAIGLLIIRLLKLDVATFLPAVLFPNTGNMGLPLCLFAFGQEGLALGLGAFMVMMLAQFTLGLLIVAPASGTWKTRSLALAKHPVILAMALAVLMLIFQMRLPRWAANTVDIMGGFAIPLMMITLGVSLATLRLTSWPRSLVFSLLRVAGGAALGFVMAGLMHLDGAARGVVILQAAMPAAVMNYVLALEYRRGPEDVAAMVLLSTLLSFVLLPALLLYLL